MHNGDRGMNPELLLSGDFKLASGVSSDFKIDCDAMSNNEIAVCARLLSKRLPEYGRVIGVPSGGLRLAAAMMPYATSGPLLIVDDVWTTGGSMERFRAGREAIGAVIFFRPEIGKADPVAAKRLKAALFVMMPETATDTVP